ncbi:MAG: hypothetical protein KA764_11710 [Anaerolineales bacterium]|nr:hypothetical protein [Anaerolineales bacterium]
MLSLKLSRVALGLAGLGLAAACQPLALPTPTASPAPATATPPPVLMCTPPPCLAGEVYHCPNGDCPGGCGTTCATPTPGGLTPTYPPPMCTPPACWSGEVYFCAGECLGGCGTTCATRTPDPQASPAPTFPAPETLCTLPQPAPAAGTPAPAVFRCASAETVRVGETFTVLAEASGLAEPIFAVQAQDQEGFGGFSLRVKAENQWQGDLTGSQVVTITAVQASGQRLLITLTGSAAGRVDLRILAGSAAGPFVEAEALTLTITAP